MRGTVKQNRFKGFFELTNHIADKKKQCFVAKNKMDGGREGRTDGRTDGLHVVV